MNEYQKRRFTNKIIEKMFNSVSEKKLTIFGFSFKKNTGDTRESPAIYVCKYLLDEGAHLNIYDPKVTIKLPISFITKWYGIRGIKSVFSSLIRQVPHDQIIKDLTHPLVTDNPERIKSLINIFSDSYKAAANSHAVVICTEWDEFRVSFIDGNFSWIIYLIFTYFVSILNRRNWISRKSTLPWKNQRIFSTVEKYSIMKN